MKSPEEHEAHVQQWRDAVEHISRLAKRANYEFVSKNELREIARNVIATLHIMYVKGLERAVEEARPESSIITSDQSLIVPTPEGV